MAKKRGPNCLWWCKAYGEGLRKRELITRTLCPDGLREKWPECRGCTGPTKYLKEVK